MPFTAAAFKAAEAAAQDRGLGSRGSSTSAAGSGDGQHIGATLWSDEGVCLPGGAGPSTSSSPACETSTARQSAQDEAGASATDSARWRCGWLLEKGTGTGAFGRVHKAMASHSGRLFAIKSFDIHLDNAQGERVEEVIVDIARWRGFQHPNLVRVFGHSCTTWELQIHLEYVPSGSLASFLQDFGPLEGEFLKQATLGVFEGLNYLHSRAASPVVHGNIKSANILMGEDCCVKLTDFGCARLDCHDGVWATISSLPWMAPEVVQGLVMESCEADIWSTGCTIIEMVSGHQPWGERAPLDSVILALCGTEALVPPMPDDLPHACRDLLHRCLQRDPSGRSGAAELLGHAFLTGPVKC